jgi:hypothetical protein
MATVDSDKVVCGGIHAMTVAVLVKIVHVSYLCLTLNMFIHFIDLQKNKTFFFDKMN